MRKSRYTYLVKAGAASSAYLLGLGVKSATLDGREINYLRGLSYGRILLEIRGYRKGEISHNEEYAAHDLTERVLVLILDLKGAFGVAGLCRKYLDTRGCRGVKVLPEKFFCFINIAHDISPEFWG